MSLTTLIVSVCLTMALLCGMLTVMFMMRSRVFLPKYTKMPTVCDLIDYATMPADDIIVLKSGCLMSMMELFIPDMSAYSESKLASCYELCQKALLKLEGNYAIQIDAIRSEADDYAPTLHTDNVVLQDLESRRSAKFSSEGSFDTHVYLTITYVGDSKQTRLLAGLLTKSFNRKDSIQQTVNLLKDFRLRVKIVADSLRQCFPVEILTTQEVILDERLKPICAKHAAAATADAADSTADAAVASTTTTATVASSDNAAAITTTAVVSDMSVAADSAKSKEETDASASSPASAPASASASTLADAAAVKCHANDALKVAAALKADTDATTGLGAGAAAGAAGAAGAAAHGAAGAAGAGAAGGGAVVGYEAMADAAVARGKFLAAHRGKRRVSKLLSVIHECITGKRHMIAAPGSRAYLDSLLATEDYISGYTPKMGAKFISMLSIEGLPSATHEALLNTLATLPFAYRFNSRFVIFDHAKSKVFLMKYRGRWSQSQKGIFSQIFNIESTKVNQNAVEQVKDIDRAQRALDNNEVMFGSYTANVIIYDELINKLQEKVAAAIAAIEKTGLAVRVETVNSDDAFFGSLPGHIAENLRRPLISQDVLLDLVPLSLPPRGERFSPNPLYGHNASPLMQVRTEGGSKYLLNLHEKDVGNTLVIGPTGAGKSMLLSELMVNLLRYPGMRIFAFDKGCSFHALTKAVGGNYIVLNNTERMLSPLYHLETEEDKDYAQSFIELLLRETNVPCTPEFRYEIKQGIRSLASFPHHLRRLSDLHGMLCNQTLKQALSAYTAEQNDNCILDGNEDTSVAANITTFECAEVFSRPESFSVPVLKHVFRLIERQLTGDPVAIVVDEAWLMLRDSLFADELLNWFKTLRKYNAFVILATQSLTDLQASEHFENILECAKTRIFLPNCDAVSDALRDSYTMMGLSDQEIDLVATAVPKRDYYFVKGEQRVIFNLMLSAEEKALLSIAGEHCVPSTNAMYDSYGPLFYTYLVDHDDDDTSSVYAQSLIASHSQGTAPGARGPDGLLVGPNATAASTATAAPASAAAITASTAASAATVAGAGNTSASAASLKAAATVLKDAARASNAQDGARGSLLSVKGSGSRKANSNAYSARNDADKPATAGAHEARADSHNEDSDSRSFKPSYGRAKGNGYGKSYRPYNGQAKTGYSSKRYSSGGAKAAHDAASQSGSTRFEPRNAGVAASADASNNAFEASSNNHAVVVQSPPKSLGAALWSGAKWLFGAESKSSSAPKA